MFSSQAFYIEGHGPWVRSMFQSNRIMFVKSLTGLPWYYPIVKIYSDFSIIIVVCVMFVNVCNGSCIVPSSVDATLLMKPEGRNGFIKINNKEQTKQFNHALTS